MGLHTPNNTMKSARLALTALGLISALTLSHAQSEVSSTSTATLPHQLLHLNASDQTDVQQDWLVMTLAVQKEGPQASGIQKQLNAIVAAALAMATPSIKPGLLELSTGRMSVSPRYGRDGKINAWQGSAQVVLQGSDAEQITLLASKLQDLTVSQINWKLSPEQRNEAEMRIQAQAVERFKIKARALTQQFGFAHYTLKEVRVSGQETGEGVMPRMAMVQMDDSAASPVPTLPGKSRVVVNITGSIQMR